LIKALSGLGSTIGGLAKQAGKDMLVRAVDAHLGISTAGLRQFVSDARQPLPQWNGPKIGIGNSFARTRPGNLGGNTGKIDKIGNLQNEAAVFSKNMERVTLESFLGNNRFNNLQRQTDSALRQESQNLRVITPQSTMFDVQHNFQVVNRQIDILSKSFNKFNLRITGLETALTKTIKAQTKVQVDHQKKIAGMVDAHMDQQSRNISKFRSQLQTHDRQIDSITAEIGLLKQKQNQFSRQTQELQKKTNSLGQRQQTQSGAAKPGSPGWLDSLMSKGKWGAGGLAAGALLPMLGQAGLIAGGAGFHSYATGGNYSWLKKMLGSMPVFGAPGVAAMGVGRAASDLYGLFGGGDKQKPKNNPLVKHKKAKNETAKEEIDLAFANFKLESKKDYILQTSKNIELTARNDIVLKGNTIRIDGRVIVNGRTLDGNELGAPQQSASNAQSSQGRPGSSTSGRGRGNALRSKDDGIEQRLTNPPKIRNHKLIPGQMGPPRPSGMSKQLSTRNPSNTPFQGSPGGRVTGMPQQSGGASNFSSLKPFLGMNSASHNPSSIMAAHQYAARTMNIPPEQIERLHRENKQLLYAGSATSAGIGGLGGSMPGMGYMGGMPGGGGAPSNGYYGGEGSNYRLGGGGGGGQNYNYGTGRNGGSVSPEVSAHTKAVTSHVNQTIQKYGAAGLNKGGVDPGQVTPGASKRLHEIPFRKGGPTASERYHNPGAQWPSERAEKFGMTGYGNLKDGEGNKIGNFPSNAHGGAANMDLFARKYKGMTLDKAMQTWRGRVSPVPKGWSGSDVVTDAMVNDPNFMVPFFKGMAAHEGRTKGNEIPDQEWQQAYEWYKAGGIENVKPKGSKVAPGLQRFNNVMEQRRAAAGGAAPGAYPAAPPPSINGQSIQDKGGPAGVQKGAGPGNLMTEKWNGQYGAVDGQGDRPHYYRGMITMPNGKQVPFGSGGAGRGSTPYGTYLMTPQTNGDKMKMYSRRDGAATSSLNYNQIDDPLYPGAPRKGIAFHKASGRNMVTEGCIGIEKGSWEEVNKIVLDARAQGQKLAIRIGPDGQGGFKAEMFDVNNPANRQEIPADKARDAMNKSNIGNETQRNTGRSPTNQSPMPGVQGGPAPQPGPTLEGFRGDGSKIDPAAGAMKLGGPKPEKKSMMGFGTPPWKAEDAAKAKQAKAKENAKKAAAAKSQAVSKGKSPQSAKEKAMGSSPIAKAAASPGKAKATDTVRGAPGTQSGSSPIAKAAASPGKEKKATAAAPGKPSPKAVSPKSEKGGGAGGKAPAQAKEKPQAPQSKAAPAPAKGGGGGGGSGGGKGDPGKGGHNSSSGPSSGSNDQAAGPMGGFPDGSNLSSPSDNSSDSEPASPGGDGSGDFSNCYI
jgi:hypothetical protein